MKKYNKKIVCLSLVFTLALSGCGASSGESKLGGNNNVQSVIEEQIAKEEAEKTEELTTEATTEATTQSDADALKAMLEEQLAKNDDGASSTDASDEDETLGEADPNVDIDLTVMSSNMVYSTVYQMMADAQSYVGKKIKMKGNYYASWYDDTQMYYHYVIIQDATACCQQGLEFVWDDGSHVYPDEYPKDMAEVEVVGTFETYKDFPEDEYEYCRLKDATLVVCDEGNNE
ncbi:MAG: hypothetical protein J5517_02080 [Eubacterium sp.]|nr:hypothetical protein [Eubacterium sp.]